MNIFDNAPSAPKTPTKASKSKAPKIDVEGVERLAALEAVLANIEAQIEIEKAGINAAAMDYFVEKGMAADAKPTNPVGTETGSEASLQLKLKSSRSALKPAEVELLKESNIPFDKKVNKDDTFIINPKYVGDAEMMEKVSDALTKVDLPADFILHQEEESISIATNEGIDAIFALENEATVRALLPICTTQATRATLAGGVNAFEVVERIMEKNEAE